MKGGRRGIGPMFLDTANVQQPLSRAIPKLVRVPEAAEITGLPLSLLRKSFMREDKRPENVPPPPPHKRIGRAIYILTAELHGWVESLGRKKVRARGSKRVKVDIQKI